MAGWWTLYWWGVQGADASMCNLLAETESLTGLTSSYSLLTTRDPAAQVVLGPVNPALQTQPN